tara:strand:- start:66 stop:470 length:405 start_codon:yes stop_codon:yes gene_type:complete
MFGNNKKSRVAEDINWRKLEKDSEKSEFFDGFKMSTQKTFKTTGKRPDFFAYKEHNSRDRIVADAKCVKDLKFEHVDQVKEYKRAPGFAKKGRIFVAKDTHVPHDVRRYAKGSDISIERRNVKRKKGFWDRISE